MEQQAFHPQMFQAQGRKHPFILDRITNPFHMVAELMARYQQEFSSLSQRLYVTPLHFLCSPFLTTRHHS